MALSQKIALVVFTFCILSVEAYSSCNAPFNPTFSNITTSSTELSWIDVNGSTAIGWEIELVEAGSTATGLPTSDTLLNKNYLITGLNHSSVYTVFLRTVCAKGTTEWNGPFSFNTHIKNTEACDISIGIEDNDCNDFIIDVSNVTPSSLGEDIFIEEINLSIAHTWPRDLKIELTSPNGKTVILSAYHGNSTDNYGDPADILCESIASFNNEACQGIEDVSPPFIGTFKAEGDINLFLDGSNPNGLWTLNICDRADDHIGVLKFIEIVFSEEVCPIPSEIVVQNINATEVEVKWTPPFNCGFLRIEWGLEGFSTGSGNQFFVNCQNGLFTIPDLEPNTSYDIYLRAQCSQSNSPFSCVQNFVTACTSVSERQNFDTQTLCEQVCGLPCNVIGNWINDTADDHDWIVNAGATPSSFTGPNRDPFLCGNYLYIENTPSICNEGSEATLISNCININQDINACHDLSFWYHMFGLETNELRLDITEDDEANWQNLFIENGDQGDQWILKTLDLSAYYGKQVRFRFVGISGGSEGDIAIDQIQFFGSTFLEDGTTYFIDNDLDGFGSVDSIVYCGTPLNTFSLLSGDCNDADGSINPTAVELPCNLIDENCNGNDDDPIQTNPVTYQVVNLINESCGGVQNGEIALSIDNGTSPYEIEWNNGLTGNHITALGEGVYFATITDGTGCKIQTDFIEIDALTALQIFPAEAVSPSCAGIDNGWISVDVIGGSGPYNFVWDDGSIDSVATDLNGGDHFVTITDINGCRIESEAIKLITPTVINAGVQLKTDLNCYNGNNGSIQIGIIQGSGPFDFGWDTGETGPLISGLSAGYYNCTITDTNGCYEVISDIEITQPDSLEIFIEGIEDVRCHGEENGRIELSISGGTAQYSYLWNTGTFTEDLFNLSEGNYQLTVTDSKGCQTVGDTINIVSPQPIVVSLDSLIHVDCPFSETGQIGISVSGGTPQYDFFWDQTTVDTSFLDGLSVGTYDLTILDRFECKESPAGIEVSSTNLPININSTVVNNNLCFGDSTGLIIANVETDRWPLDFNWNSGVQNIINNNIDSLQFLPNGQYQVTVTDAEGCVGESVGLSITSPEMLSYFITQAVDLDCHGENNGILEIQIDGGVMPYDLLWNNGATDTLLTDLPAGEYLFDLLDANNCPLEGVPISINQPDEILLTATVTDEINGNNNGSISVDVEGGTPFYFYDWSPNANTLNEPTASNLSADTYLLSILDANSCTIDTFFVVDNISGINDLLLEGIRLEQNLVSSLLQVSTAKTDLQYSIFTIDLKLATQGSLNQSIQTIDVSQLAEGHHLLYVSDGVRFRSFPFVIVR